MRRLNLRKTLLVLTITSLEALTVKAFAAPKTVTLNCGDIFDGTANGAAKPLRTLVQALKSHPQSNTFRVNWWESTASISSTATAVFDRGSKTLRYFERSESHGLGYEGFRPQYKKFQLSGVTDSMLQRLLKKHQQVANSSGSAYFSDFSELSHFGARFRKG